MNTRNLFAFVLSVIVIGIALLAILGIWNVIEWQYVQKYFWKSVQSLIIVLISSLVIYMIHSLLGKPEVRDERTSQ
jgi:hypothetical protein